MMKKLMISLATAAVLLVACSGERESVEQSKPTDASASTQGPLAVDFDAYQQRNGATRSGLAGVLNKTQLQKPEAEGGGFGVFAYYTDLKHYDQTYVPNFMYNQGVFWNSSTNLWEYTPLMYWPNEYGFDASSDDEDHLTFFAYAPFVESASAAAGTVADATYGIVGFSRNNATGDPMVKYVASFEPAKSVDLCWGVVPSDKTAWAKIQNGSTQTLTEGLPWLNVERPLETASQSAATTSRVKFKFNHALAQLNVQIDADADVTNHLPGTAPDAFDGYTKIYVRSISFTGIALQGALNLNNSTPEQAHWLDYSCTTDLAYGQKVTIHDGRRDSREGAAGAEAANEMPQGLNPNIIQNSVATDGVTTTYQNLFKPTSTDPADQLEDAVCVIPTGEAMTITIVYDVETTNPDLATFISDGTTHGMSIENKVTKTVTFGGVYGQGLESNKRYALKLHLGMNSVKFDAEVQDWADNTVPGDAWLPSNTRPILLNHTVMYLGAPQALTATTDPVGQAVAWDNTDGSVATFSGTTPYPVGRRAAQHIDATYGYNTVTMTPVAIGTTNVTASLESGDKATCTIHVVPVTISSLREEGPKAKGPHIAILDTISKTKTATLTPVCFGAAATPPVDWTVVPATGVVSLSVDASTKVCTVTGVGAGTAVVTCTNTGYTSDPATYTVTVTVKNPTVTAPTAATNWTYDGSPHNLFATAGSITGGTLSYSIDGTNWYADYDNANLKATNAGSYTLLYKVTGEPGYADVPSTPIGTVTVAKATPTITLGDLSGTVRALGRDSQTFTVTLDAVATADGVAPSVSSGNTNTATVSLSSGTVTVRGEGVYADTDVTITVSTPASTNFNAATATKIVTINALSIYLNPLYYVETTDVSGTYGGANERNNEKGSKYLWSEVSKINTQANTQNKHVPTGSEWAGIIPADYFGSISGTSANEYLGKGDGAISGEREITVSVGRESGTPETNVTDRAYIWNVSDIEQRAIRFIGTDRVSAWSYKRIGGWTYDDPGAFVIKSVLIDWIDDTTDAQAWYSEHTESWETLFSGTLNSEITIEVSGRCTIGSTSLSLYGEQANYWAVDQINSTYVYDLDFDKNWGSLCKEPKTWGFSVRLFKNN